MFKLLIKYFVDKNNELGANITYIKKDFDVFKKCSLKGYDRWDLLKDDITKIIYEISKENKEIDVYEKV